jgi:hypothetical protein
LPPNLDIYCLTKRRDADTINSFLDRYVDRAQSEDREDEELMIRRLDAPAHSDGMRDYEWEPALTLSHTVHRGLGYPRRSFNMYLKAKEHDIDQAILGFTTDDQLVLGLSIDDAEHRPENFARAKELLSLLAEDYGCHRGLILAEQPPPNCEEKFVRQPDDPYGFCLYSCAWQRQI